MKTALKVFLFLTIWLWGLPYVAWLVTKDTINDISNWVEDRLS